MAGPNRTVAVFRNRKLALVAVEAGIGSESWAEASRDRFKSQYPDATVKITKYRTGPKGTWRYQWKVSVYQKIS